MMCRRNQHFFCRPCIMRHLRNSETCPTCKEELTLETLNQAPRIVTDCLSELNIRCEYFKRGCREFVQLGNLESHVKNCGFSPVMCSNEGCLVEINKRDRIHHETEACEFRKVKCHDCGQIRQEMDGMKINIKAMNDKLEQMQEQLGQLSRLATLPDQIRGIQTIVEDMARSNGANIAGANNKLAGLVIAGGWRKVRRGSYFLEDGCMNTVEWLDLEKKSWVPLQPMKQGRYGASSFVFRSQMIVIGGGIPNSGPTTGMASVNLGPFMVSEPWLDFPAELPAKLCGHSSIVYDERLLVIGGFDGNNYSETIHEVLLMPPYTSKFLTRMQQWRCYHGSQLFNDKILICGGRKARFYRDCVDSVIMYDISKNECKQMSPLPYVVCEMATVSWGDNVIVIGGADKDGKALDTVVIYNVKTEKSYMLPAMICKRKGCAAVVVGNTIVVMGGMDERGNHLNSVESFRFDNYSWEDLPAMNEARSFATAVAW